MLVALEIDPELIDACRRGSREAFRALFEMYQDKVYSIALRYAGNPAAAMDITQDVFEHLFDPAAAFREIARTLRPGGAHVFTTPLVRGSEPTQFCTSLAPDGTFIHLTEPEYHGNPISSEGSLVTVNWGYDITNFIFETSGLFTEIVFLDILEYGIRAEYIEVLIARRDVREVPCVTPYL